MSRQQTLLSDGAVVSMYAARAREIYEKQAKERMLAGKSR